MSSKGISRTISEQWLSSAWETWRDTEREYDVNIGVAFFRTPQRGVVKVHAFALELDSDGKDPVEVCSSSRTFPSAHTMMLETLLFQLVSDVARELYHKHANEQAAQEEARG